MGSYNSFGCPLRSVCAKKSAKSCCSCLIFSMKMNFDGTKVKIYSRLDNFGAKFVVFMVQDGPSTSSGTFAFSEVEGA